MQLPLLTKKKKRRKKTAQCLLISPTVTGRRINQDKQSLSEGSLAELVMGVAAGEVAHWQSKTRQNSRGKSESKIDITIISVKGVARGTHGVKRENSNLEISS